LVPAEEAQALWDRFVDSQLTLISAYRDSIVALQSSQDWAKGIIEALPRELLLHFDKLGDLPTDVAVQTQLAQNITAVSTAYRELQSRCDQLAALHDSLQMENMSMRAQVDSLSQSHKADLDAALSDSHHILQTMMEYRSHADNLERALSAQQTQLVSCEQQIAELQQRLQQAEAALLTSATNTEQKAQIAELEVDSLRQQIAVLQRELQNKESMISMMQQSADKHAQALQSQHQSTVAALRDHYQSCLRTMGLRGGTDSAPTELSASATAQRLNPFDTNVKASLGDVEHQQQRRFSAATDVQRRESASTGGLSGNQDVQLHGPVSASANFTLADVPVEAPSGHRRSTTDERLPHSLAESSIKRGALKPAASAVMNNGTLLSASTFTGSTGQVWAAPATVQQAPLTGVSGANTSTTSIAIAGPALSRPGVHAIPHAMPRYPSAALTVPRPLANALAASGHSARLAVHPSVSMGVNHHSEASSNHLSLGASQSAANASGPLATNQLQFQTPLPVHRSFRASN
jgi:hypothetical protein